MFLASQRMAGWQGLIPRGWLMSQFVPVVANGRFFGLDMGDWSVLLSGGFALAGLVLFLT
jgi:hypothetical protein